MQLVTLGAAALEIDGEPARLQPLPVVLLAYVAVEGPQARSHLAELFWRDSANGLNSLSTTLSRIRASAPGTVWSQRSTIGSDVQIDLTSLRAAITAGKPAQILDMYKGSFLPNPGLRRFGAELEDWVLQTRAEIASDTENALLRSARAAFQKGKVDAAADLAERAYAIITRDGIISPEFFTGYYQILAEAHRPLASEVLREAHDFGIELEPIEFEVSRPASIELPTSAARAEAPTIIGFEQERSALHAAVATTAVTQIIGLGGCGKTTLAAEFMATQDVAKNAVWVDLRAVEDPDLVEAAISNAFDVSLALGQPLAEALKISEPTIAVLDNFEQLTDAADVIASMVQTLPELRIVVTSRVPLSIEGSTLIRLAGLSLETSAAGSPAQQVLLAAADRSGADLPDVSPALLDEVCHLVGGLPLALELAGSWARILPLDEIARSLRQSSDLLDPTLSDRTQRSMKAVVHQSLRALDAQQRNTLEQLAVYPGGCLVSESSSQLGLSVRVIGDLVDRSLVTIDRTTARLQIHPLIIQQVSADLAENDNRLQIVRHRQLDWCRALVDQVAGDAQASTPELLATIGPDLANILATWRWAAANGHWSLISFALPPVREFFVVSGRLIEGEKALAGALNDARSLAPPPDLLVRLLEGNAWLALLTGQPAKADSLITEARHVVDEADDVATDTEVMALRTAGTIDFTSGQVDKAAVSFERALELVSSSTPRGLIAKLHDDQGACFEAQGRIDEARQAFRATLDLGREVGDPLMVARGYLFLAGLEQTADPRRCLTLLNEGLTVAREHGLDHLAMYFPLFAGQAHLARRDFEAAKASFAEGLEEAGRLGHRTSVAAAYVGLAESLVTTDSTKAREHLTTAIRVAIETKCKPYLMWAGYVAADLTLAANTDNGDARSLLARVMTDPALEPPVRLRASDAGLRHGIAIEQQPSPQHSASADIELIGEDLLELLLFG